MQGRGSEDATSVGRGFLEMDRARPRGQKGSLFSSVVQGKKKQGNKP